MRERELQAILAAIGGFHLVLGVLALVAPGTFFNEVGHYGLRNDHYVGDVGAFYAASGIALLIAIGKPSWRAPLLATGALWYGLHALNHAFDIGEARSNARGISDTALLAIGAAGSAYLARISARLASADRER